MSRVRHEERHASGFLRYCLAEALTSLRRRWRVAVLSTLLLAAAVFVLAAYLLASEQLGLVTARMNAAAELSIYLARDAGPGTRDGVEAELRRHPIVARYELVDAAQATERFLRDFPELRDVVSGLPDGPFGAVVELRLTPAATERDIATLVGRLSLEPGVDDVIYDRDVLARVLATINLAQRVGGALAVLLALAATIAVAAVLRLAYYARRDEIDVLGLLGAPPRAVTGPFVVEGMLQALAGTIVALVALRVGLAVGTQAAARWLAALDLEAMPYLSWTSIGWLCVGGVLAGAGAGWLAAREPRDGHALDVSTGA
jgi:cell division transport system permease protein